MRRASLALSFAILLLGCSVEPGTVSLEVLWGGNSPGDLWLLVKVEQWAEDGERTVVHSAGPTDYGTVASAGMELQGVPADQRLVVVLEAREGADEELPVVFYGISEPFELRAGEDLVVTVPVDMVSPGVELPASNEGLLSLVLNDQTVELVSRDDLLELHARVGFKGASRLVLANDAALSTGRVELTSGSSQWADSCQVDEAGWTVCEVPWDVTAGLFPEATKATDGRYSVHARLVDSAGYAGPIQVASVMLDGTPPTLTMSSVTLLPAPGNPLATVSLAGPGSTVVVLVVGSEMIAGTPPPSLVAIHESGAGEIPFQLADQGVEHAGAWTFLAVIDGEEDGLYVPIVSMADLAGNSVETVVEEATFPVRTSSRSLLVDQDALKYARAPWGTGCTVSGFSTTPGSGLPTYRLASLSDAAADGYLPGTSFILEDGSLPVQLRVYADEGGLTELARINAQGGDASTAWPMDAFGWDGPDSPWVFVAALDEAGNATDPVPIEHNELSVSPGGLANPHEVQAMASDLQPALLKTDASLDMPDLAADVALCDDVYAIASAGYNWIPASFVSGAPGPRTNHGMAYDSLRGRTVLFGGYFGDADLCDTWEWDGVRWLEMSPGGGGPGCSSYLAMAYDSVRGRSLLYLSNPASNGMWEWDGMAWNWQESTTAGPSNRISPAMVHDSQRKKVWLFGGKDMDKLSGQPGSEDLGDTWQWDGSRWTKVEVSGPVPPPRDRAAMGYDSDRGVVVMYGGFHGEYSSSGDWSYENRSDVWEWNGHAWSKKTPAGAAPTPGPYHRLAYDTSLQRMVLFDANTGLTWSWNGQKWAKLAGWTGLGKRFDATFVYDSRLSQFVLFGGRDAGNEKTNETWLSDDGKTFAMAAFSSSEPAARSGHRMAANTVNGEATLFGGFSGSGVQQATWTWDGGWSEETGGVSPPKRDGHGMAYDSGNSRVVLFGGMGSSSALDDLWEWDGESWSQKSWSGSSPAARAELGMTYDPIRKRTVVYGGSSAAAPYARKDTWEWNGASWQQKDTGGGAHPPAARGHTLAYNGATQRTLMFGGRDGNWKLHTDLWEWNGSTWQKLAVVGGKPPGMIEPGFVYNEASGTMLLMGAEHFGDEEFLQLWEWDGASWTKHAEQDFWPLSRFATAAVSLGVGQVLLYGGNGPPFFGDTWLLDGDLSGGRPFAQLKVSLSSIGFEPSDVTGLSVGMVAGAERVSGTGTPGVSLLGWRTGGKGLPGGYWAQLASSDNSLEDLETSHAYPKEWVAEDVEDAAALVVGSDEEIYLRVVPSDYSESDDPAVVAVDYIGVKITYER